MTDPLPELTQFLSAILLYSIYAGLILVGISAVWAGILFLPIFGFNAQRAAMGETALRMTGIGLLVIVLALPARAAVLHYFPLPAGVPVLPVYPTPTPTAGS